LAAKEEMRSMLDRFYNLIREFLERRESVLRFNVPFLCVSEISEQYYCERKVEMARVLGEIATEHKIIGQEAHEALLKDAVKIKLEEGFREIFSDKPKLFREMLLLAKIKGVVIAGRPDAVLFYSGIPLCLFEYKFTARRIPFRDMHVQARLYCLLLNEMGFNAERLKYAIILVPQKFRDDEEVRRLPLLIIKRNFPPKIETEKAAIFINDFNKSEALKELEWAMEYWLNKREAKPTSKPGKCKSCEYAGKCPSEAKKPEEQATASQDTEP
jgi:CRISPR/Cas system-associated exonuclease Cas4 (RecB family)